MQLTHLWYKLSLHRLQIILFLLLVVLTTTGYAQKTSWVRKNNPNYDDKKLTYGFLIGLHTSSYQVNYDPRFVTQDFDTVFAVRPKMSAGFSLGFIVNYKLADLLDIRLTPKVGFYENKLTYLFTDDTPIEEELVETTMVEFPILLKYKSERRGNIRMYMIGGVNPAFEASGKKNSEEEGLEITGTNLSLEAGFGFDLYYPLFKFSPEIRFSHGLIDILGSTNNKFGQPLSRVNTNTVTVYFLFQ